VAADEFNRLAPWEWMHDSRCRVAASRDEGNVAWFDPGAVAAGVRAAGLSERVGSPLDLNTILNDGDPGGWRVRIRPEQDLVKAEFVLRRDRKEDQAVLAAAGLSAASRRRRVWPQFASRAGRLSVAHGAGGGRDAVVRPASRSGSRGSSTQPRMGRSDGRLVCADDFDPAPANCARSNSAGSR
jgi:hypothetical protein